MSYLIIDEAPNPGAKTKRWIIYSFRTKERIGYIEFRPTWRKYVWGTLNNAVFDVNCTEEVVQFLKDHAEDRQ